MSMKLELFPYQREGFEAFMERDSLLLAFDTGLGKTATGIAIAEELLELRYVRKVLLVVPSSLKFQWAKALAMFTDLPATEILVKGQKITIPAPTACVIVDGTPERRKRQYAAARSAAVEYVVVGYDQVVSDWRQIRKLDTGLAVVDEASAIKTPGAQRTKAVKHHLGAVPFRLALTATPIENRPEEVFSIMQWVDETVLGRYDHFDRCYIVRDPWGKVSRYRNLDVLHEKLATAMVRKTRHDPDVAPYMPDVVRDTWQVELDDATWDAYKLMLEDLLASYDDVSTFGSFNVDAHYGAAQADRRGDKSALGKLMSIHESMQMLLNHPSLLARSANLYLTTETQGSKYASQMMLSGRELPTTSPKLDHLVSECDKILRKDPAAKILVFTRYKGMLGLMGERFDKRGYGSVRYDGDMSAREKEGAVALFASDPGKRMFFSSHAAAYGTDMPFANWLINFDIARSAGLATQINGRHVRASSTFDTVHIRDMVVGGTIEDRKLAQQLFKNDIGNAVIDGQHRAGGLLENDLTSLKSHAKSVLDPDEDE